MSNMQGNYKLEIAARLPNDYSIESGYSDSDGEKIGRHGYKFIGSLEDVIAKLNQISQTHEFAFITITQLDRYNDIVFDAHDIDNYGNSLKQVTVSINKVNIQETEPFFSQLATEQIYTDPDNLDFSDDDDFTESCKKTTIKESCSIAEEFKAYENLWS